MSQSMYRYGEVILYALVNFLPYLILAVLPFWNKLRFSKHITIICIIGLTLLEVILEIFFIMVTKKSAEYLTLLNTAIYIGSYFLLIRDKFGKTLFTLFMLTNFANFIVVASTYLANVLFHTNRDILDHWTTSFSMIIIQLITLSPLVIYFLKKYIPTINMSYDPIWNYLWLIPVIFYFFWNFILYHVGDCSSYEMALRPSTSIFLFLTTLGSWLIYHIIIMLIHSQQKILRLKQENYLKEIQSLQYKDITTRISEARIIRHDIRHHITILDNFIMQEQYDELHNYLVTYKKTLNLDSPLVFCENQIANLIIGFFEQQAQKKEIDFNVHAQLPSTISFDNHDMSTLLGNLLENAIDGCSATSVANKTITLTIKMQTDSILLLSIQNTADCTKLESDGKYFYSTKHEGLGMGLISVKQIVERYNGTITVESKEGLFSVYLLLYLS